jgi:hypothetical protein
MKKTKNVIDSTHFAIAGATTITITTVKIKVATMIVGTTTRVTNPESVNPTTPLLPYQTRARKARTSVPKAQLSQSYSKSSAPGTLVVSTWQLTATP